MGGFFKSRLLVPAIGGVFGVGLFLLLWFFPTSWATRLVAVFLLVFIVLLYFHPDKRNWRMARTLYGMGVGLAFAPSFELWGVRDDLGLVRFASTSSPWTVAAFLLAGSLQSWLDYLRESNTEKGATNKGQTSISTVNSPGSVSAVYGGTVVVQQGTSDDTLRVILDQNSQLIGYLLRHAEAQIPARQEHDLIWRLIEDIKTARRRFEVETIRKLVAQLGSLWEANGQIWPRKLRHESIVILAEDERGRLAERKKNREPVDLSRLKKLLSELEETSDE